MDRDWMPKNPCEGCEKQTFARMESSFTVYGKCVCLVLAEYSQVIMGQRKLLEYLFSKNAIGLIMYKDILKQLEG